MEAKYLARFLSRIDKSGECWIWTRGHTTAGYGTCYIPNLQYVHRAAYEHFIGPISPGLEVMHLCNNPTCCRPDHLRLGTHAENMRHMAECKRGRGNPDNAWNQGSKSPRALLNEDQVAAILADDRIFTEIAADYGVTKTAIQGIRQRQTWKHLPAPEGYELRKRGRPTTISDDDVRAIRAATGSIAAIAKRFGVNPNYVGAIRSGKKRGDVAT